MNPLSLSYEGAHERFTLVLDALYQYAWLKNAQKNFRANIFFLDFQDNTPPNLHRWYYAP